MTGPTAAKTVTDMDHKANHKASKQVFEVEAEENDNDEDGMMTMMMALVNIQIFDAFVLVTGCNQLNAG